MLTPHRPNELAVRGHQDRPLQPQELLPQIQESAVRSPLKRDDGMPYQLLAACLCEAGRLGIGMIR